MAGKRTIVIIAVFVTAAALSSVQAKAAGRSSCSNLPVTVTFTEGAITSDGGPGTSYGGVVDVCTSPTPTYNLNMNLIGTSPTRSLTFNFPADIPGSSLPFPTKPDWWTGGELLTTQPTMILRNILWGRMNGLSTFTTRLIFQNFKGPDPNDTTKYELLFQNEDVVAVTSLPPNSANTNNPYMTTTVTVQDLGGDCIYTGFGHWIVSVDTTNYTDILDSSKTFGAALGTLSTMDSGRKSPETRLGQYNMPITFDVVANKCAPAHP